MFLNGLQSIKNQLNKLLKDKYPGQDICVNKCFKSQWKTNVDAPAPSILVGSTFHKTSATTGFVYSICLS